MTIGESGFFQCIHETAEVEVGAIVSRTAIIWRHAHVSSGVRIGENCVIGEGVHIGPHVTIGNDCKIQNGAQLFEGVALQDDVFIGPHVVTTNVLTPRAFIDRKAEFKPTLVKRGASIGANATIICGVTIGEYAMIGAGSVVTKNVGPYELVIGNPAKHANWICRCGAKLQQTHYAGHDASAPYACTVCTMHFVWSRRDGMCIVEESANAKVP